MYKNKSMKKMVHHFSMNEMGAGTTIVISDSRARSFSRANEGHLTMIMD